MLGRRLLLQSAALAGGPGIIEYVGSAKASSAGGGGSFFLDLTTIPLQEDDFVLLLSARGNGWGLITSTGWDENPASPIRANAPGAEAGASLYHKIMGATPDTQVELPRSGHNFNPCIAMAMAFRNVDLVDPFDVPTLSDSAPYNAADSRPNPPAITPATRAWVVAMGSGACVSPQNYSLTDPGYSGGFDSIDQPETWGAQAAHAYYNEWYGDTYDPPQFSGGKVGIVNNDNWIAYTIALRSA